MLVQIDIIGYTRLFSSGVLLISVLTLGVSDLHADESRQTAGAVGQGSQGETLVQLMRQRCFACHAGESPEAGIGLDTLDLESDDAGSNHELLQRTLTVVESGRMPPPEAESLNSGERERLRSWLERRLGEMAEEARQAGTWTRNRRLTVDEYNFTMQRLFGIDANFSDRLPPDPISSEGYRNNSELLGLSPLQMECYLDAAREAVGRYVRFDRATPEPVRYHIELEDLYYSAADRYGTLDRAPQPVSHDVFLERRSANRNAPTQYVGRLSPIPPGRFPTIEKLRPAIPKLHQQYVAMPKYPSTGEMVVRIRAAGTPDRDGRPPRMRVESGITLGDGCSMDTRVLGEIDVTAARDQPSVYEFRTRVEDVPTKGPLAEQDNVDRLCVFDMLQVFISNVSRDDKAIYDLGRGGYRNPKSPNDKVETSLETMAEAGVNFLYLDCIEIEMLPGPAAGGSHRWSVDPEWVDNEPQEQRTLAAEFVAEFMREAYREPVSESRITQKMELFDALRKSGYSFEDSLRETLTAVLVSPSFLFLEPKQPEAEARQAGEPTAHQRACRLSYFLWQAPPDDRLRQLADDGSLLKHDVYTSEAERLLDDSRTRRFLDDFCRQWLRLDKHQNVAVNPDRYPDYDDDLAKTTIRETLDYVAEVFASGVSAVDLLDSGYALLNDRLADHYGLDPIPSGDLRRVSLPGDSIRGGLLTQASVLTMNSDGRDSHPVRRGVWLLERLLNTPPPPPPPNVPDLDREDPDLRGLSLKEQLELHREPSSCRSCHRKIDPWGIALENFDATGQWREAVRAGGSTTPVDAAVTLPGGKQIDGVHDFKQVLMEQHREQFTTALTHHMLTYALGRSLDHADRKHVEAIHRRFAAADYRLKELVSAVVDNEAFRQ